MKPILSMCLATVIAATPAFAWDRSDRGNLVTWTFQGSELSSYEVVEPTYNEDPAVLKVWLWNAQSGSTTVEIEADLGVGTCPTTLAWAQGKPSVRVTLVANLDATTLNGVTLQQCSTN